MVKKRGCDLCNKDYNEGTGLDLKFKNNDNGLWKLLDVCPTCYKEKLAQLFALASWYKYNKETKRFDKYEGT